MDSRRSVRWLLKSIKRCRLHRKLAGEVRVDGAFDQIGDGRVLCVAVVPARYRAVLEGNREVFDAFSLRRDGELGDTVGDGQGVELGWSEPAVWK